MSMTAIDNTMNPGEYWNHCAQEWHNVAEGAHYAGQDEVETYFEELSTNAAFIRGELGYN